MRRLLGYVKKSEGLGMREKQRRIDFAKEGALNAAHGIALANLSLDSKVRLVEPEP